MQLLGPLLKIQNQLRIFHWQTDSYAAHKAFGKAYESLDGHIDSFVEIYMGKYGKTKAKLTYSIELVNLTEEYSLIIDDFVNYLEQMGEQLDSVDTDLLNIRDEMLGELNTLKYLLTLS